MPKFGKQAPSTLFGMPPALSNTATFSIRDEKIRKSENKQEKSSQDDLKISNVMDQNFGNEF